ncbi:hypothetical protein CRV08_13540, partial [Halarcobacter ebronensis]
MFKNISIKMKLIASFSMVSIFVAFLSIYSVSGISESSDGFSNYRAMAKDSLLASGVQSNMLMLRMNVKDFLNTSSDVDIKEFNDYYKKTSELIKVALKEIENPKRAPLVKQIDENLIKYKEDFEKLIKLTRSQDKLVLSVLTSTGKKIEVLLNSIMVTADIDGKNEVAIETAFAIRAIISSRLSAMEYKNSKNSEDLKKANKDLDDLSEQLIEIRDIITNVSRKDKLLEAIKLVEEYKKGLKDLETIFLQRDKTIDKTTSLGENIAQMTEDIKVSIKEEQDSIGPRVAKLNSNLMKASLTVSIIIILCVIFFAIVIPVNIAKSIKRLNDGILNLLNSNDVRSRVEVLSKDELGEVSTNFNKYLQAIEDGLKQDSLVIDDVKRVVNEVKNGILSKKVELDTKNESLKELKNIFNQMLELLAKKISPDMNEIQLGLDKFQKLDFTYRLPKIGGETLNGLNSLSEIINEMLVENKSIGLTLQESADILLENVESLSNSTNEAAAS